MLKAVLFDMDGTLVDINLGAFIAVYARDLARLFATVARRNPLSALATVSGVIYDLNNGTRDAGDHRTNWEYYCDIVEACFGVPLGDPIIAEAFSYYDREVLPRKNDAVIAARPRAGALEALEMLADRGIRTALFTNPSFTRECIACRMGWGGIADAPFELVTTMENCTRVKPDPAYYLQGLARLGLSPDEVLMVGNDPKRDFPTPDCGIQTAFVGRGKPVRATWCGSMADFAANFDEVLERFYERQERDLLDIVQDVHNA